MNLKPSLTAHLDEEGRRVLRSEVAAHFGLKPGGSICIDEVENSLRLRQPATHLAKVYVEPTNRCNLACRTCIRNTWDEAMGWMADATFARIVEGVRAFSPPPGAGASELPPPFLETGAGRDTGCDPVPVSLIGVSHD